MEIVRFTLRGDHAFFKKPEVNSYVYFTYGNIHKVALLGMFGAILGYGGYTQMKGYTSSLKKQKISEGYPEFYEKLKDLKVSILPSEKHSNGIIGKNIQTFNNSVGYASKEQGGNLIVKEQWLEHPEWEICILIDCEEAEKLKESLCGRRSVFYPYLGKNDHPADILDVSVEEANAIDFVQGRMNCLIPVESVEEADLDEDEDEPEAFGTFRYREALPYEMDNWVNRHILKTFLYTDSYVCVEDEQVYELSDKKNIVFY